MQRPSHAFTANGSYTVSLTVGNGSMQATETKTGYIQVGPQGMDEDAFAQQIKLYPIPAKYDMQIESPEKIELLRVTNLSGHEVFRMRVDDFSYRLNVSHLNSGVYFLLIETQKGNAIKRFTIK
jgi:PKD repeat protein